MENWGTWLVGLTVLAAVVLAARKVYKDRKNGKGCGQSCDGCSGCPRSDDRHSS